MGLDSCSTAGGVTAGSSGAGFLAAVDFDSGAFLDAAAFAPEVFAAGADGLLTSVSGVLFPDEGAAADGSTAGGVNGGEDSSGAEGVSGAVIDIGVGTVSVVWLRRTPRMPAAPADTMNAAAAAAMNPDP